MTILCRYCKDPNCKELPHNKLAGVHYDSEGNGDCIRHGSFRGDALGCPKCFEEAEIEE
jgi:hypothetical protein